MRFFKDFNGFIFEFNSVGEYLRFLLARLVGTIIGVGILALIVYFLWWYGQQAQFEGHAGQTGGVLQGAGIGDGYLWFARAEFKAEEYHVPDGVVTICSMAFATCRQFVTLHIPRSVRLIGDFVFGPGGGKIIIEG